VKWRHNYIAHRNSHFALNPKKFDAHYPLPFPEIDVLLSRASEIGNRGYSLLFDASAQSTLMIGRDDYLNLLLKAVRVHMWKHTDVALKSGSSAVPPPIPRFFEFIMVEDNIKAPPQAGGLRPFKGAGRTRIKRAVCAR